MTQTQLDMRNVENLSLHLANTAPEDQKDLVVIGSLYGPVSVVREGHVKVEIDPSDDGIVENAESIQIALEAGSVDATWVANNDTEWSWLRQCWTQLGFWVREK